MYQPTKLKSVSLPYLDIPLQKTTPLPPNLKPHIPHRVSNHLRPLNPPPALIKPYLLPRDHRLLQRTPNPHRLHRSLQRHRHLPTIQTPRRELIRFRHKRVLEPPVIRLRDLPPDAPRFIDLHQVLLRAHVDGQFALRTDNLGGILLARSHHPAGVKVGDFAVPEFYHPDRVVAIVVLAQLGRDGGDAAGGDGFDHTIAIFVGAEEPEREIDVVDTAVDEDAARILGVGNEEARRIRLVAGL